MKTNLARLLQNLAGAGFVSMDTETTLVLKGGKKNPHQGLVTKRTTGSQVIVFTNSKSNGYENMVRRRLEKEGKNPDRFELQPRKWGARIPGTPIVEYNGKHYIEVIFLRAGKSEFYLNGAPIARENVVGLQEPTVSEDAQGGLENMVIIRTFALESILNFRYDQINASGPFEFKA